MLQQLRSFQGDDPSISAKIDELELSELESKGDTQGALNLAEKLAARYENSGSPYERSMAPNMRSKAAELRSKLGLPPGQSGADTSSGGTQ